MGKVIEVAKIPILRVVRETDKAILIRLARDFEEDLEDYWIPLSQITEIHKDGDDPYIICARWLAERKGLI